METFSAYTAKALTVLIRYDDSERWYRELMSMPPPLVHLILSHIIATDINCTTNKTPPTCSIRRTCEKSKTAMVMIINGDLPKKYYLFRDEIRYMRYRKKTKYKKWHMLVYFHHLSINRSVNIIHKVIDIHTFIFTASYSVPLYFLYSSPVFLHTWSNYKKTYKKRHIIALEVRIRKSKSNKTWF